MTGQTTDTQPTHSNTHTPGTSTGSHISGTPSVTHTQTPSSPSGPPQTGVVSYQGTHENPYICFEKCFGAKLPQGFQFPIHGSQIAGTIIIVIFEY